MSNIDKRFIPLIIAVAAASFMVNLDTYIINVSIPAIAADLSVSKADISWVVMSYNLMVVSLLLICGKLADITGVKKLFVFGFILFTTSSLFCALSQNLPQLIASRVLQGIGASILYAMPQAMIAKFMPKEQRGAGFGFSASAAALGIMLGSPVSGLITGLSSWHWIFLINIPVGIAVISMILLNKSLNEEKPVGVDGTFDVKGALTSFLAVLGLTLWLNKLNSVGFANGKMIALLLVSLFLSGYFIYNCKKTQNPLIKLDLFKNRYFSYANSAMFLISGFLAGNNFIMPFYFSEIKNLSEFQTGLMFIIYSASYMTFSMFYGKISAKVSAAKVSSIAALMSVLSIIFFIKNIAGEGIYYTIILFILLGMSFSFFITSNNNFVMLQAKKNEEGAVAGLHRMTGRFGMLFGVVVFEFIFSSVKSENTIVPYIATYIAGCLICILTTILSAKCVDKKT